MCNNGKRVHSTTLSRCTWAQEENGSTFRTMMRNMLSMSIAVLAFIPFFGCFSLRRPEGGGQTDFSRSA